MLDPYDSIDRVAEFRPRYSQGQTQRLVQSISTNPHLYTENTLSLIKDHAAHFKIPFDPPEKVSIDPKENEFNLVRGIGELGAGFISGFSTFEVGEPTNNVYENIMRQVGHLAGFVGYIPSAPLTGAARLVASAGVATKAGRAALAAGTTPTGVAAAKKIANLADMARALRGRSVPMFAATQIQKQAKKIAIPTLEKAAAGRAGVTKAVSDFLLKDVPSHLAEGAFHLGVASAVGSWQHGIDEMLSSGLHGGLTGAAFRGIGNIFKSGGIPKLDKTTGKRVLTVDQKTDQVMRTLAASLYTGLPSTYRGETAPEQVYAYLLGAFFGAHETSAGGNKRAKFMNKIERTKVKDPKSMMLLDDKNELPVDLTDNVYDAKLVPGFEKLSPDVQKAVIQETGARYGTWAENPTILAKAIENLDIEIGEFLEPEEIADVKNVVKAARQGLIEKKDPIQFTPEEKVEYDKVPGIIDKLAKKYPGLSQKEINIALKPSNRVAKKVLASRIIEDPDFLGLRDFLYNEAPTIERIEPLKPEPKESKVMALGRVEAEIDTLSKMEGVTITRARSLPGKENRIGDIKVAPSLQRTGIGTRIVDAFKELKSLQGREKIEIDANAGSEAFWEAQGFKFVSETREGYPIDAKEYTGTQRPPKQQMYGRYRYEFDLKNWKRTIDTRGKPIEIKEDNADDNDGNPSAGGRNTNIGIERKAVSFLKTFFKPRYKDLDLRPQKLKVYDDTKKLYEHIKTAVDKPLLTGFEQLVKDINKEFQQDLGPAGRNKARQLLRRTKYTIQPQGYYAEVVVPEGRGKPNVRMIKLSQVRPENILGNNKSVIDTLKEYDSSYHRVMNEYLDKGQIHPSLIKMNPWVMVDHYITSEKNNKGTKELVEYKIAELEDISIEAKIMQQMADATMGGGYYYFGGKNDSGKMYFYSHHPESLGDKGKAFVENVLKEMKPIGRSRKSPIKLHREFINEFVKKYGGKGKMQANEAREYAERAFASNMLWAVDLNGLKKVRTALPQYEIGRPFQRKSKPLAITARSGRIRLDPNITKARVLEHMKGLGPGGASEQKKLVTKQLEEKHGISLDDVAKLLVDDAAATEFVLRHEGSHLRNKDTDEYFKNGKDMMTQDKIDIEVRATLDAYNEMRVVETTYEDGFKYITDSLKKIASPKAFNKRMQIWMTDGQEADPDYHLERGSRLTKHKEELAALKDGKLRYILMKDTLKTGTRSDKAKAEIYKEVMDGAILVREDYFDVINSDFGMVHSGQQKSFIVDPNMQYGALLGKFMFHRASKEASDFMKEQGIQMIIPESSAKESGARKFTKIEVDKSMKATISDLNVYDMKITSIKGLLSEANTAHLTQDQNTPKQLMTNLTRWAFKPVPQSTIDEMFDTWVKPAFLGEEKHNKALSDFLEKDPAKVNQEDIDLIVRNMDKYGLEHLINAIRDTRHHQLVGELYKRILKVNSDVVAKMAEEGEITNEEYDATISEAKEFNSFLDRILQLHPHVSVFLYKDGQGYIQNAMRNFAVHTVTRPKQTNSISARMRPYDPWTMVKFPELNKGTKKASRIFMLDDIFKDRKIDLTNIQTPEPGREYNQSTLGEAWKTYQESIENKNPDKNLKEFFEALSMRVPMDSMSGAHDLTFGGFTGIDGHGIVLHPRTMQALGGADLDGDKAFVFFGMPKKFRKVYGNQINEFMDPKTGIYRDSKLAPVSKEGQKILFENPSEADLLMIKERGLTELMKKGDFTFRDLLTTSPKLQTQLTDENQSPLAMYSPLHRLQISKNHALGRFQLGPAVVSRATLSSAHAAMVESGIKRYRNKKTRKAISIAEWEKLSSSKKKFYEGDKSDEIDVTIKSFVMQDGKKKAIYNTYQVYITPREDLTFARDLMRSEVGFPADPLDETGLSGRDNYFNWAHKAFFKADLSQIPKNKYGQKLRTAVQPHTHFRAGTFQTIYDFNSAYYGMNFNAGRRHYLSEISEMAKGIRTLTPNQQNTFLPKMVNLLGDIKLEDDILARYDKGKLFKRYDEFNRNLTEIEKYSADLGRPQKSWSSKLVGKSRWLVENALEKDLFDPDVRSEVSKLHTEFKAIFGAKKFDGETFGLSKKDGFVYWPELMTSEDWKAYKKSQLDLYHEDKKRGKRFSEAQVNRDIVLKRKYAKSNRSDYIERFVKKASHFVQNDQMDRTSMTQLLKYIKIYEETPPGKIKDVDGKTYTTKFDERFIGAASRVAERLKQIERSLRIHAQQQEYQVRYILRISEEGLRKEITKLIDIESTIPQGELRERLDVMIERFKSNNSTLGRPLNKAEADLFDTMLLSTYYRTMPEWPQFQANLERIEKIANSDQVTKRTSDILHDMVDHIRQDGQGTYMSKVGASSPFVHDDVVTDFLRTYSEEFENVAVNGPKPGRADKIVKQMEQDVPKDTDPETQRSSSLDIFERADQGVERIAKHIALDPASTTIMNELRDHIKHYQNSIGKDLNILVRGMVGKNLDAMDLQDYRVLNNQFRDMRTGNWFLNNFGKMAEGIPILSKRHWMMFPRAVSEEHIIRDFIAAREEGAFRNYKGEMAIGPTARPTHFLERTQYIIGQVQALAIRQNDIKQKELQDALRNKTGYQSIPEGRAIYEVAFTERDLPIMDAVRADMTLDPYRKEMIIKEYQRKADDAKQRANWVEIEDKKFFVETIEGTKTLTGRELAERIKKELTERANVTYKWIRGKHFYFDANKNDWVADESKDPFDKYYVRDANKQIKYWDAAGKTTPVIDVEKFVNKMLEHIKEGIPVPMDFGLDGIRKLSRSVMLENPELTPEYRSQLANQVYRPTGHYPAENYNPHINGDKAQAKKMIEAAIKNIERSTSQFWTEQKKSEEIRKLVLEYHRLSGDYMVQDVVDWQMYTKVLDDIVAGRKVEESKVMKFFNDNPIAGSMRQRASHIGGWASDPSVWETYQKNLIDTYYRQIGQLLARSMFNDFSKKYKPGGTRAMPADLYRGWRNFYSDYILGALGYPSEVPDSWLEGPKKSLMNVSGTPYSWWADNRVANRLSKIKKMLGFERHQNLPEELAGVSMEDLRHWSNLEAKFEMAALLAHPKSSMGNLYGGTMHTIQSVGWRMWRNAHNLNYINTMMPGAQFTDMSKVNEWVVRHGIIPEYIIYEAGLDPAFQGARWKDFLSDAVKILQKDPMVKDTTLREVAKKYKITEGMYDKAAWFMREPERLLRRQAFVAHYLQARELYGHAGMKRDHPMLINIAKRGVQATQFLYSAPYRPAFSRTALGKVMTRFQTWAWNAVRFRREVIQEARRYGYREGTQEFERFKRLMLTDMFVFSLANVFAYSLFEAALPAPWAWLQDTADWIFGDEGERDRAFFGQWPKGLAPLQMITPPIARLPVASLKAIVDDDWSRISGYYIWTMFPFGRIARDIKGIAENPMMTIEKMTGIPYVQFSRQVKKHRIKDEEEENDV